MSPAAGNEPAIEVLEFAPELSDSPDFERSLRARVDALREVVHPSLATIYGVTRPEGSGLCLLSEHIPGQRLSELPVEELGSGLALDLIRTVTPALEELNHTGVGVAHGALSANRVVKTPDGRLVLVEQVLGWAIESLHFSRAQLNALGIVVPQALVFSHFDGRTDLAQLGFLALSLRLQRHLDPADCPAKVPELLKESAEIDGATIDGAQIARWLERALQTGPEPFASVQDGVEALYQLPATEADRATRPDAFREFADESGRVVQESGAPLQFPRPESDLADELERTEPVREAASLSAAELRAALVRPHADAAPEAPIRKFTRTAAWILGIVSVVAIGEAVALVLMASHIEPPVLVRPTPAPTDNRAIADPLSLEIPSPLPGPSALVSTPVPTPRSDRTAQSSPAAIQTGRVSLNATPWAEVIIDGRDIGQTPIANFSLPVGKHEIVFRHPQLGERRQTITIQPGALLRVAESFQ